MATTFECVRARRSTPDSSAVRETPDAPRHGESIFDDDIRLGKPHRHIATGGKIMYELIGRRGEFFWQPLCQFVT
jgi:hypothetical protein